MFNFKKSFDIITFGSATRDIHVNAKNVSVDNNKNVVLPFGSKIDVDSFIYTSGGGGTNAAATFSRQGFKTAFCGAIGVDEAGLELVRELKSLGVDLRFLVKRKGKITNHSVIITSGITDRVVLAYRGASELVEKKDIPFEKFQTKWIYLAPLSGAMIDVFYDIVDFAKLNNIRVAVNPSSQQLKNSKDKLMKYIKKIDILFLNKEEASLLTDTKDEDGIINKMKDLCPSIFVVTNGGKGLIASDCKNVYTAKPSSDIKVKDTLGAGDAFASGFLCDFIRFKGDIEKAIQFGIGNAEGNLKEMGAKTGLLKKGEKFNKVEVVKT